jgi:hypothetical protein
MRRRGTSNLAGALISGFTAALVMAFIFVILGRLFAPDLFDGEAPPGSEIARWRNFADIGKVGVSVLVGLLVSLQTMRRGRTRANSTDKP